MESSCRSISFKSSGATGYAGEAFLNFEVLLTFSKLYYLSPFTYLLGGMIIAVTGSVSVDCNASDLVQFTAPDNETCASYASEWVSEASAQLLNPEASGDITCQVCMLTSGSQYLDLFNLNGQLGGKWGCWAIFLLFTFSNLALVYLFTWATRVKGKRLLYFI